PPEVPPLPTSRSSSSTRPGAPAGTETGAADAASQIAGGAAGRPPHGAVAHPTPDAPNRPTAEANGDTWTLEDATNLYGLSRWPKGHFAISKRGTVVVMPDGRPERAADLFDIVEGVA